MPADIEEGRLAKWDGWLKAIYVNAQELIVHRHIFVKLHEFISANPRIQQPSALYDWIASTYAASSVMTVRRLIDMDQRAVSLVKLLVDIRRHPQLLSRDRFVARYPDRRLGDREFDRVVGAGIAHLEADQVRQDLKVLRRTTAEVERFATKRIAHWDEAPPANTPTFDDLHQAVDAVERLTRKYLLLISGRGGPLLPIFVQPWEAVLREPWIAK